MKKITIVGIINGVDVRVDLNPNQTVAAFRNKACEETNNTGRPFQEWEVHDDSGRHVSSRVTVGKRFKDGARVFLNLKVGAGGCCDLRLAA